MARITAEYGSLHVGVRREGSTVWPVPGRAWETFDRVTGARIGPLHATLGAAIAYAEYREGSTYANPAGLPCDLHGSVCR